MGGGGQIRVPGGVCLLARGPQHLHRRVHRAGGDLRLPGLEQRSDAGRGGRAVDLGRRRFGGEEHGGLWVTAELTTEQPYGRLQLPARCQQVSVHRVRADEQLLVRVRQGVQCDQAARVPDAVVEVADAQRVERRFLQCGLGQRGEAAPLADQPRLEGRTAGELHAFEQFRAESLQLDRVLPARGREYLDVEAHRPVAGKAHQRPGQGVGSAEQAAHLAEIPPQGAGGVLRAVEQQRDEPCARNWGIGQREVGDDRPRLVCAQLHAARVRAAQQPDPAAGGHGSVSHREIGA